MRLLLLLLLFLASAASRAPQRAVKTQNGTVVGFPIAAASAKAWQFLGIPFAEKPLGPLRFAKPQPLRKGWSRPLVANKAPNRCPQQLPNPFSIDDKVDKALVAPYDEDCLYLNVWTPQETAQPKAVMIWFHGGAYVAGESLPVYHGAALAALHDVVVVTAHYRLGALGFLGGNWGMFDQQAALRWVQGNIAAFGGDPGSVTIFGESAGGFSATFHLLNPDSARLFHRAIAESGTAFSGWAYGPAGAGIEQEHHRFAAQLNCSGPAPLPCLRTKGAREVVAQQLAFKWLPVVDADFLRAEPRVLKAADKDVMLGVNEDEGGMLTEMVLRWIRQAAAANPAAPKADPEKVLAAQLFAFYPNYPLKASDLVTAATAPLLQSHVDPENSTLNLLRMNKAFGDACFVCPLNLFADHLQRQGNAPFVYLFAHRSSFSPYAPHVGATHGDEVAYVFRLNVPFPSIYPMTPAEQGLARRMAEEWTNFAKTGRPASKDWRRFSAAKKDFFEFSLNSSPKEGGLNRDDCAFWNDALPKIAAAGRAAEKEEGADRWLLAVIAVLIGIALFIVTRQ